MAEDRENNKLRRIDESSSSLDSFLNKLDKEKQDKIIERHLENKVDLEKMKEEKVLKSRVAEHDLKVGQDNLDGLGADKRYYTHTQKVETGSGNIEIKVKGGDTKFIIPIITFLGIIIIVIVAILFL